MSAVCPHGHTSATTDYCDECGAVMGAAKTVVPPPAPVGPAPAPAPATVAGPKDCPSCATPRTASERFCENCGYDFQTGKRAEVVAPAVVTANPWRVTADADRAYFDTTGADDVSFPRVYPTRSFFLKGSTVRIGRRSQSQGVSPEIDLSCAPEDVAVSHLHAVLTLNADGSWSINDPGSTNGTLINDGVTSLLPSDIIALRDGDRIHVGAWTTLTIHQPS